MMILSIGLLAVSILLALALGSTDISLFSPDAVAEHILWNIRIPRALFAAINGAMLGMSGSLYQLILRNPLADGFTTGAASSAALGAACAIALGAPAASVGLFALASGLAGLWLVFRIASTDRFISPVTLILCGVVLNIIASSVIGFIKFFFEESVTSIVFWLMGGFFLVTPEKVAICGVLLLLVFGVTRMKGDTLNILALDEASARSLGVNVRAERRLIFLLATVLVAVSVSFTGIIGFVGLIVPHVARSITGSSMQKNLTYSALFGATLLTASDTLSRVIVPGGAELPVGIITAILGGGFFFSMLIRRKERLWYE